MSVLRRFLRVKKADQSPRPNKNTLLQERGWINFDRSSRISGMDVIVRIGEDDKCYLDVGKESMIKGRFIIENDHGKISIGDRSFIGGGTFISTNSISIGNDVLISWGCTFMDNNAHSLNWEYRKTDVEDWIRGIDEDAPGRYKKWDNVESAPIIIKDKAWVGFNSIILKGVTVGEGAIVAAGSVVTKDVPDYTVAAGNPAKIVKRLN